MSQPSHSDVRLSIRALRQGWDVPAELRSQIVEMLAGIVADGKATPRERTSAARAPMQASRVTLDAIQVANEAECDCLTRRLNALEEVVRGRPAEIEGQG